jgi:hypothetical protein
MTLPHHTEPAPHLTCPECWQQHQVRGAVRAIVAQDGTALYFRCDCGSSVEPAQEHQLDLFGRTAA